MKHGHMKKPDKHMRIAIQRIKGLFEQAYGIFEEEPALSNRYVKLARRIAMKHKIRLPADLKRSFCKHCGSFLKHGKNCRVRITKGKVVYFCRNCRKYMRFPCRAKKQISPYKK